MISRDRCGSFAQGAREGAPQARQVADRFHILQNLREAIQAQLGRAAGSLRSPLVARGRRRRARACDFAQPTG
jgi:transposase